MMLFYGVDITDKITFNPKPETPQELLNYLDDIAHSSTEKDLRQRIEGSDFLLFVDDKVAEFWQQQWSKILAIVESEHPFPRLNKEGAFIEPVYRVVRYKAAALLIQIFGEALERACPWLNDLRAALHEKDAENPLIFIQDVPLNSEDEDLRLLVGFWPAAFPLECGKSVLPKDFLEEADWIEWSDHDE